MTNCAFQVTTFNFGEALTNDDVNVTLLDEEELYLEGVSRGLTENDDMCNIISREIPSLDWQEKMILWYTNLSDAERSLVSQYTNYETMNRSLRNKPSQNAPINDIIAKAIPLPDDTIVYRHFSTEYLPEQGNFTHHGYR